MVSYLKSIPFVIFVAVLVAALSGSVYFKSYTMDRILPAQIEQEVSLLAQRYSEQSWCRFQPLFERLSTEPYEVWFQHPNFKTFLKMTNAVLGVSSFKQVSLLGKDDEVLFSSVKVPLLDETMQSQSLVLNKPIDSQFIGDITTQEAFIQVKVALPSVPCDGGVVADDGFHFMELEVIHDVSGQYQSIETIKKVMMGGALIAFISLFVAFLLSSRRAEYVIHQQHEEKLRLEEEKSLAETQSQQKSMFLANISHELRTPLNAIIGFSEIIKDEVMGPVGHPQYREYVNDINSSGVHLLSLINDILDYSKAEARKLDVEFVDADITKITNSCIRLIEPRANDSKVTIRTDLPEAHITLRTDPKRIKQIILNLLSNAVKFTPEDGEVTLAIAHEHLAHKVTITVADTGIGIAQKDISKAMSPFGQIDSSLSRRYEGTGLGLPLTKKLVEIMGGDFSINSEVGVGTTVRIVFPTEFDDATPKPKEF